MLSVKFIDGGVMTTYVGMPFLGSVSRVESVQADGQELMQILSWGLPNCKQSVQTYFEHHAKFITGNWR